MCQLKTTVLMFISALTMYDLGFKTVFFFMGFIQNPVGPFGSHSFSKAPKKKKAEGAHQHEVFLYSISLDDEKVRIPGVVGVGTRNTLRRRLEGMLSLHHSKMQQRQNL